MGYQTLLEATRGVKNLRTALSHATWATVNSVLNNTKARLPSAYAMLIKHETNEAHRALEGHSAHQSLCCALVDEATPSHALVHLRFQDLGV